MLRQITLVISCLLCFTSAIAQSFSYIYIQGDKQTPFYVKFEDEMLPRFGKNYYIISELAPGPINIEILFQQHAHPAQKFTINVPDNGFRGFLLTKKETGFSLYDIHQHFYLPAGNKAEDDKAPERDSVTVPAPAEAAPPAAAASKTSTTVAAKPLAKQASIKKTPAKPKAQPAQNTAEPVFLDVELKSERTGTSVPTGVVKNKPAIVNSDCPRALSNSDFQEIYKKTENKPSSSRLKYLLEKMDACYTTNQVRQLARMLTENNERFTFLKAVYPRVTDQSVFHSLESLLTEKEWKDYFKAMLQP